MEREIKIKLGKMLTVMILSLENRSVSRGKELLLFCVSKTPWGFEKVSILLSCIPNWNSQHCFWVVI